MNMRLDGFIAPVTVVVFYFWPMLAVTAGEAQRNGYAVPSTMSTEAQAVAKTFKREHAPLPAADDLKRRWDEPGKRLRLPVGEILPRWSPDKPEWKPGRIAAVDFSCMMFGLAASHPKLGVDFFREATEFTFEGK